MDGSYLSRSANQSTTFPSSYMNIQNESDLLPFLPRQFETRIQSFNSMEDERPSSEESELDSTWFHTEIRLKVYVPQELLQWLEMFQRITNTKWNRSNGAKSQPPDRLKRITYKLNVECQHSSRNKVKTYARNKSQKNLFCMARMYLRIRKDCEGARRRDPHYGYFGHISIKWAHSHPLGNTTSLSYLRNPQLKQLFGSEYFEKGILPVAACRARAEYLQTLPGFEASWLENGSICPDPKQAWQWYDAWRSNYTAPLPEPVSKRQTASRARRDDLLSQVADLLTEKFNFLTGNASVLEVETLQNLRDRLEKVDSKHQLLEALRAPQEVTEAMGPPKVFAPEPPKRRKQEILMPKKEEPSAPIGSGVYVIQQRPSSSAVFEEEMEEFVVEDLHVDI